MGNISADKALAVSGDLPKVTAVCTGGARWRVDCRPAISLWRASGHLKPHYRSRRGRGSSASRLPTQKNLEAGAADAAAHASAWSGGNYGGGPRAGALTRAWLVSNLPRTW